MSVAKLFGNVNKKTAGAVAAAVALAATTYATFSRIKPDQFGLRDTFFIGANNTLKPGIHPEAPFVQYTHKYDANTEVIDFNAGSCRFIPTCDSTADQNPLTSELVLHYRVLPETDKLRFHRWEMEKWFKGPDGYWALTDMLNTSANAILGQKSMAKTLNDPDDYLKAVYSDLSYRLQQNNFPVEIQSLELKGFKTWFVPTRDVSYDVTGSQAAPPVQP